MCIGGEVRRQLLLIIYIWRWYTLPGRVEAHDVLLNGFQTVSCEVQECTTDVRKLTKSVVDVHCCQKLAISPGELLCSDKPTKKRVLTLNISGT